jgi:hypothetical protein
MCQSKLVLTIRFHYVVVDHYQPKTYTLGMPLQRKAGGPKTKPLSFRFNKETARMLRVLSEVCHDSQASILDQLIRQAYKAEKDRDPEAFRKAGDDRPGKRSIRRS